MMNKLSLSLLLLVVASSAWAGDAAYTIRATELKVKPYGDAEVLRSLPARTKVEVLKRQSSWTQVKAGTTSGWVKMLSLQLEASATGRRSDNGLSALFNVATTGRGGSTVTTGVRGLSEEQLKNAQPDPQALRAAKKYAASRAEAKRFADEGKLQSHDVDYLSGGR